jgi:DNA (cytosine-5)-methyltransferase 1
MADGIVGKKGVLWWQIERWVRHFKPTYLFLENVDRLLKSPTHQRGRDFAVMLSCLALLGYEVEWRVINAADYGFPQKRRRVFIVARHVSVVTEHVEPLGWLLKTGILAKSCPVATRMPLQTNLVLDERICSRLHRGGLALDPGAVSRDFNLTQDGQSVFRNAGYMRDGDVWSFDVEPRFTGRRLRLRDVLEPEPDVPDEYRVKGPELAKWKYLKGPKRERRVHPRTGFEYLYTEGGIPFPDPVNEPARTILTGEGGRTPSRFKHLIAPTGGRRYRRLTPTELERLNGFPDGWTDTGMPSGRRAFCMGNALVVGIVRRIGKQIVAIHSGLRKATVEKSRRGTAVARV